MTELSIPRCVKPNDFGQIQKIELHHFSDASSFAYGQVSYIRLFDNLGKVHSLFYYIGPAPQHE